MKALISFINKRSAREIILFKILWICGCFFVCFEYFAYPSFLNFQAHKDSKNPKTIDNIKEAKDFLTHFNHTSLPPKKILQIIQENTQSIQEIDNQSKNSTLCIKGTIQPPHFLPLLQKLSSPALFIQSFYLDSKGDFSLIIKDQKITTLSPLQPLQTSPQEIFNRFSTPKFSMPSLIFYTPLSPEPPLTLEAIFNQKAKINGVWIGLEENIQEYTLKEIHPHFIVLEKNSQLLKLYLKEKRIFQ